MKETKPMRTSKKVAVYGILIALTLVLSYVERLIPVNAAVPGIKLGLANIAVLIALYMLGNRAAIIISLLRAVMTGLLFSGITAMFYSFAGALCSVLGMIALRKAKIFGIAGVSVFGAILHISAQVAVSRMLLGSWAMLAYYPLLLGVSCVTGVFNGVVAGLTLKYIDIDKHL